MVHFNFMARVTSQHTLLVALGNGASALRGAS